MKDLLGRPITPGCYIAYALTAGRSANLAVYQVREVLQDKVKAHKLDESYGSWDVNVDGVSIPAKYVKFEYDAGTGKGRHVPLSPEERAKVDEKTVTLAMGKRALIIDASTINHLKGI